MSIVNSLAMGRTGEALVAIASVASCAKQVAGAVPAARRVLNRTLQEELSEGITVQVSELITGTAVRIQRILSVGSEYNDDEYLLLITLHTELSLVIWYLQERGLECPLLDLDAIELEIRETGRFPANARALAKAISLMRRNWGLDVEMPW